MTFKSHGRGIEIKIGGRAIAHHAQGTLAFNNLQWKGTKEKKKKRGEGERRERERRRKGKEEIIVDNRKYMFPI